MRAWLCFLLCLSWSYATGAADHAAIAIASPEGASIAAEDGVEHPARTEPVESEERRVVRASLLVRHHRPETSLDERGSARPVAPRVVDRRRELRRARVGAAIPRLASDEPRA